MTSFADLIAATRIRMQSWLAAQLPAAGLAVGIGVTALAIGATLGQLSAEAQTVGWGAAIAVLSAELGKDFIVGLLEQIRDNRLSEENIARIMQAQLDTGIDLPDLRRLLDEVGTLSAMVERAVQANNAAVIQSLQADLAAYPALISARTANALREILTPRIDELSRRISRLDAKSELMLAVLTSLSATPRLALEPGAEPPLLVFVSSLIGELSAERQALRQAITGLGIARPWIFESSPASPEPLETAYLEKVRACDFFVLLIDEAISPAVEKEFDAALEAHRPVLAFLKQDKDGKDRHRSNVAQALIRRIPTKWATFGNPTDLALGVRVALTDEIIRRVRSGSMPLLDEEISRLETAASRLTRTLRYLPSRRYTRLVGREGHVHEIASKLRTPDADARPVVAITGLGGIGKTALAYEVVERLMLEGLFDGLVWESAKPEELEGGKIRPLRPPTLSFEALVSTIAQQLGQDGLLQLPPHERTARIRTLLQTGSYLLVVDNLETIEAYQDLARQLHDLLSPSRSSQPSRALLTSRERLIATPYIDDVYIGGLSKPASLEFLRQESHDRGVAGIMQADAELLGRIFDVTHGMPLAMKLIVSQFIAGIPVDTELDRLEAAREEDLYRFIYMRLWFQLSIAAQKILIAAAAFASSVARFMLQPVSQTADEEFEAAIPELVHMSLIEPSDHALAAQRRYSIHPITRWFINAPLRELWDSQKAGFPEQ